MPILKPLPLPEKPAVPVFGYAVAARPRKVNRIARALEREAELFDNPPTPFEREAWKAELKIIDQASAQIVADDDVPDLPAECGACGWIQDGEFARVENLPDGAKPLPGHDLNGSIKPWWTGSEWVYPPNAKDGFTPKFADAGMVAANMAGPHLAWWDAVRLKARMKSALAGDLGDEAKAAAERIYKLTVDDLMPLGWAIKDRPALIDDVAAITGRLPDVSRTAMDGWLLSKNKMMLSAEKVATVPEFGTPSDIPAQWKSGYCAAEDVFPAGASTDAYQGGAIATGDIATGGSFDFSATRTAVGQTFNEAGTLASCGLQLWKTGTCTGDVVVEIYSGNTWGAGSLLATWRIAVSSLSTVATIWHVLGGSTVALGAGTTFWAKVYPTMACDAVNYISIGSDAGGGNYANGNAGVYDSGGWINLPTYDLVFTLYNNANGGVLHNRVSNTASVVQSTTKGAALADTDNIFSRDGATFTYDQNTAVTLHTVGDDRHLASSRAAQSTYRYAHITVNAGVTVTFAGAATATNSGFVSNPTTADTSSKSSTLTVSGTSGSGVIFTNSTGTVNTSKRWTFGWTYGIVTGAYFSALYTYGHLFSTIGVNSTYTSASIHTANNVTWTGIGATNIAFWAAGTGLLAVELRARFLVVTPFAANPTYGHLSTISTGFTTGGKIDFSGWKAIVANTAGTCFVPLVVGESDNIANPLHGGSCVCGQIDIRPTQVVPAGLAIADAGTDGELTVTWTNAASYAAGDKLVVYNAAGDAVLAILDATAGSGIIAGLTDGTAYNVYAKATSNNDVYSAACANAGPATPTISATDPAFLALEATRNTVVTPLSAVPSPANGGPAAWTQLGAARVGTGDKIYSATDEAARNSMNGTVAADIMTGKSVKVIDVTTNGTGSLAGPPPVTPAWGVAAVTAGNGKVTVALIANAPTDTLQVRYKLKTASVWATARIADRRTGSGNVDISGLTNEALYAFSAYNYSGSYESEWLSPRESTPTAGTAGAYTKFLVDLHAAIAASATLAGACTDGLPALHVKRGRFLHSDADALADLLAYGPVCYVRYVPYALSPLSRESSAGQFTAELTIVQAFDQSVSDDLTVPSDFVESLKQELMSGVDGTATRWSARALGARVSIAEPQIIARNVVSHVVRFAVAYTEGI